MLSKLSGVHPVVADRVRAILNVVDAHRGEYTITSGYRSLDQQQSLYMDGITSARPGCSQHNYGLAVDVLFTGTYRDFWIEFFTQACNYLGLTTVTGDPGHVQAIAGSSFRNLAGAAGLCPAPGYPKRHLFASTSGPPSLLDQVCGVQNKGGHYNPLSGWTCF